MCFILTFSADVQCYRWHYTNSCWNYCNCNCVSIHHEGSKYQAIKRRNQPKFIYDHYSVILHCQFSEL